MPTQILEISGNWRKGCSGPDARKKEALDDADIVIASPGIPASTPSD